LGEPFAAGRFVVPFSAFAYVLYGVYTITASGLQIQSQTRWLPITMGAAAVANVVGNLALVPLLGLMGAAYMNLAAYALLAILTGMASQRYYPVPWRVWSTAGAFLLAFGLAEAALLGPDSLAWRALCLAAYLPLLMGLRVIRLGEVREILGRLRPPR
jgi:O-antigen/teichoic acid export membrane protein